MSLNRENFLRVFIGGIVIFLVGLVYCNSTSLYLTLAYLQKVFLTKLEYYFIFIGIFFVFFSLILSFSPLGNIRLGRRENRRFSLWKWSIMVFTATMAADIIFFSLHEWIYYANSLQDSCLKGQNTYVAAITYSLFHWGITPWSFYLVPAVIYAFIMFRQGRDCYKLSQACEPLVKNPALLLGIDIISILGLILAVSTTFSLATPMIARSLGYLLGWHNYTNITIMIIVIVDILSCIDSLLDIETGAVNLANINYILFFILLVYFFCYGKPSFILSSGYHSIALYFARFLPLSIFVSKGSFTIDYTVFYWSYWIAWSIATPFFIATISEGMTIREVINYGYLSGVSSTFISFLILGYSMIARNNYVVPPLDVDVNDFIIHSIAHYPYNNIVFIFLVLTMLFMYVTTLNSIILVITRYTSAEKSRWAQVYWSLLFIFLPIILIYSAATMNSLKVISILSSLPISVVLFLILLNFCFLIYHFYRRGVDFAVKNNYFSCWSRQALAKIRRIFS